MVVILAVEGTIDQGIAQYVARGLTQAESRQAALVVLEIDTWGGLLDAAVQIRDSLLSAPMSVAALIQGRAWSAGALIALAASELAMTPGSSIGAAEPRPADAKTIAAVRSEFEATARVRGRPPQLAAAMVDAQVAIPGLVEAGQLLSLEADAALRWEVADRLVPGEAALLDELGLRDARVERLSLTPAERVARLWTEPVVAAILLGLGLGGILLEVLTPGVGLPGLLGLVALGLFFGGRMVAGLAGWEPVVLVILGLVLLAVELFVTPGFGVLGILGIAALAGGLVTAFPDPAQGVTVLLVGLLVAALLIGLGWRRFKRTRTFTRLVLSTRQERAEGYTAPTQGLARLAGARGVARTPLRPAGTVIIQGRPVDAVSQGSFIAAGRPVRVVAVEGNRVVVEEASETGP